MLIEYVSAAMRRATYEILPDGTYYGETVGFQGVYSNAATLEVCRVELQEVLEGWIVLGLRMGHSLPIVDGISLVVRCQTDVPGGLRLAMVECANRLPVKP